MWWLSLLNTLVCNELFLKRNCHGYEDSNVWNLYLFYFFLLSRRYYKICFSMIQVSSVSFFIWAILIIQKVSIHTQRVRADRKRSRHFLMIVSDWYHIYLKLCFLSSIEQNKHKLQKLTWVYIKFDFISGMKC